jgi:hypothetical protein
MAVVEFLKEAIVERLLFLSDGPLAEEEENHADEGECCHTYNHKSSDHCRLVFPETAKILKKRALEKDIYAY